VAEERDEAMAFVEKLQTLILDQTELETKFDRLEARVKKLEKDSQASEGVH
jgi:hypothetical protein